VISNTDVDSKYSGYGQALLLKAVLKGREAIVRLLLETGADVDYKDSEG
jgi:ankyrin repeat protein